MIGLISAPQKRAACAQKYSFEVTNLRCGDGASNPCPMEISERFIKIADNGSVSSANTFSIGVERSQRIGFVIPYWH